MINVLSYVGMNMQSEVCLWTLLGLFRTIFDATLFKVNANLKQVWQMSMPVEISLPVQRVLRTMISGIMLVQCFTVYIYIATYIVLLYPAFLEERPTLVLPWLLLAAIRKLLCELLSLALGLGTCVLVGAARPPCIKFVVIKIASIMPSVYMWLLVLSYYNTLKVTSVFQKFPTSVPANDFDYGLELAIRRRRTKSLLDEAQLRSRLLTSWYEERPENLLAPTLTSPVKNVDAPYRSSSDNDSSMDVGEKRTDTGNNFEDYKISSITGKEEDWFGNEIVVPRNTDRVTEQFVLMLLRISTYLRKAKYDGIQIMESRPVLVTPSKNLNLETCPVLTNQPEDTPPFVGSNKGNTASYLRLYPQIFMKGISDSQSLRHFDRTVRSPILSISIETAKTEREPIVSMENQSKNSTLRIEKATNSTRFKSDDLGTKQKINKGLNNATQHQQLKDRPEVNASLKVVKIISHEDIVPITDTSTDSDNSFWVLVAKRQILEKPNETTKTDEKPGVSVEASKDIFLIKEREIDQKLDNRTDNGQKTNNSLKDAAQQNESKKEPEIIVSRKEVKTNTDVFLEDVSINSDDSLRTLLDKMQFRLSEIISFRDSILNNSESSLSLDSSVGRSSEEDLVNSENKNLPKNR